MSISPWRPCAAAPAISCRSPGTTPACWPPSASRPSPCAAARANWRLPPTSSSSSSRANCAAWNRSTTPATACPRARSAATITTSWKCPAATSASCWATFPAKASPPRSSWLYQSLQRKVEEYEKLKEFSENIVESINVGILAADLDDRVESWNTQIEHLSGVPRDQALGRKLSDLFPAALTDQFDRVRGETGIHHIYKFVLEPAAANGGGNGNGHGHGHGSGNGPVLPSL